MKTAALVPRTTQHVTTAALAMVAGVEVALFIAFRYHYHVRLPPPWFWVSAALFNFVFFAAMLSFMRWFREKMRHANSSVRRRVGVITTLVGAALLVAAIYLRAPR